MKKFLIVVLFALLPAALFAQYPWDRSGGNKFKKAYLRNIYSYVAGDSLTDSLTVHTYIKAKGFIGTYSGDSIVVKYVKTEEGVIDTAMGDSLDYSKGRVDYLHSYWTWIDSTLRIGDDVISDTVYNYTNLTTNSTLAKTIDDSATLRKVNSLSNEVSAGIAVQDLGGGNRGGSPLPGGTRMRGIVGFSVTSISNGALSAKLILDGFVNSSTVADSVFWISNNINAPIDTTMYDSILGASRVYLGLATAAANDTLTVPDTLFDLGLDTMWFMIRNPLDTTVAASVAANNLDQWDYAGDTKLRILESIDYYYLGRDSIVAPRANAHFKNTASDTGKFNVLTTLDSDTLKVLKITLLGEVVIAETIHVTVFDSSFVVNGDLTVNGNIQTTDSIKSVKYVKTEEGYIDSLYADTIKALRARIDSLNAGVVYSPKFTAKTGNTQFGSGAFGSLPGSLYVPTDTVTDLGTPGAQFDEVWIENWRGTDKTKADSFRVYDNGTYTISESDNKWQLNDIISLPAHTKANGDTAYGAIWHDAVDSVVYMVGKKSDRSADSLLILFDLAP